MGTGPDDDQTPHRLLRLAAKAFRHTHFDDGSGEHGQASTDAERLRDGDRPAFDVGVMSISQNELHALAYGLVGVFVGLWYASTGSIEATVASLGIVATALGFRAVPDSKTKTFAIKTIRHEAHYFVVSYVSSFAIAVAVVGVTGTP